MRRRMGDCASLLPPPLVQALCQRRGARDIARMSHAARRSLSDRERGRSLLRRALTTSPTLTKVLHADVTNVYSAYQCFELWPESWRPGA